MRVIESLGHADHSDMSAVSWSNASQPGTASTSQWMTALPADWTRFALGAVAGAAALYILWRLK